uniref:Uncharacterized protein n=1 Tax=Romanomermis culicivorax TaxID=13658 RepID=A0A915JII8_ROMCU
MSHSTNRVGYDSPYNGNTFCYPRRQKLRINHNTQHRHQRLTRGSVYLLQSQQINYAYGSQSQLRKAKLEKGARSSSSYKSVQNDDRTSIENYINN